MQLLTQMTRVIEDQISHGVYISLHLRGDAVDIRIRDMTSAQERILEDIVRAAGLPKPIHEHKPEHLHIQFH